MIGTVVMRGGARPPMGIRRPVVVVAAENNWTVNHCKNFLMHCTVLWKRLFASSSTGVADSDLLWRDQFVEHVNNPDLRTELKTHNDPELTLLGLRAEATQWEQAGGPIAIGNGPTMPAFCATH